MATAATPATPNTPAQLAAQAPHRAAMLAWPTALHQLLAGAPALPGNVDMADVSIVLHGSGAIRAAQVEATGPFRAAALRQLRAALPAAVGGQSARRAPLFIVAGPTTPLAMDELSEVTDALHTALLPDESETIFGHSERATVAAGATQAWLLLAY